MDTAGAWQPLHPDDVAGLMAGAHAPWWIAGGWSLDLAAGRQTRSHGDLDVGIFRTDLPDVLATLRGLEPFAARAGTLTRIDPHHPLHPDANSVWCRAPGGGPWQLELLLDERDDTHWLFRRDPAVRLPAGAHVARRGGLPYLRPEIQLLYKAKHPRDRDQRDFVTHAPALDEPARAWLETSLARVHPGHPWLATLSQMGPR